MPNSVVVGLLRAVEGDTIILGGNLRIVVPPTLSVAGFPIGCRLTVVVHQETPERLIAESITRRADSGLLA